MTKNKKKSFRDARIVLIVAEGPDEDRYFKTFEGESRKIKIAVADREHGHSAPKHMLDRANAAIEKFGVNYQDNDSVWFVCDKDRWPLRQLVELRKECRKRNNWQMVISNPCFEVWLIYHIVDSITDVGQSSNDLKTLIPQLKNGGIQPVEFLSLLPLAVNNSRNADNGKDPFIPDRMHTRVHLLGAAILNRLEKQ